VSYDAKKQLKIDDVWLVADPGQVANADRVRSQLEGAVVFGLSLALYGKITAKNGAIEQANFDSYPLLRIFEAPRTHIELVAEPGAARGRGRAGRAADRAGARQRDLRAHRKRLREMPFAAALNARA
jgi:isoquinoline 1-oxidoreductase beta subunit